MAITACCARLRTRQKVAISYLDMNGRESVRTLWPLGMVGWRDHWTLLLAWCEMRLDRIKSIEALLRNAARSILSAT